MDHAVPLTRPKVNAKITRYSFAFNSRSFQNRTVPKNAQNLIIFGAKFAKRIF
jgi:hypothetical protein